MKRVLNHIGIDIGDQTISVAIYQASRGATPARDYANRLEGYAHLEAWFSKQQVTPANSVLCLESSGVYSEALCYYFAHQGFRLAVEPPQKTKRAFHAEAKEDHIDAQQLGEYAYRYFDQLALWSPQEQLVEQVNTLLGLREQYTKQRTAQSNELKALRRKVIQTPFATKLLEQSREELRQKIKAIDQELQRLLGQDPQIQQKPRHLDSMKSVGLLLSANLFAFVGGFHHPWHPKKIAARLGIVPRKYQSGSSVYRRPSSRRQGHRRIRKLLYLAAMNLIQHEPKFKKYYLRLEQQGKSKRLILNNIENKIIKILCALVNSNSPFIEGYQPINPALLNR